MTANTGPLVIVGGGVAGLATALSAAPRPVLLVGNSMAGSGGCTSLAQGGIAVALAPGDSALSHAEDTMAAGAGHNDPEAVDYLVAHAGPALRWLESQGVNFDLDRNGLQLGREGGHSHNRIVHAGGDASGLALLLALARAAQGSPHIAWRPPATLDAVLVRDGRVAAVRFTDTETGRPHETECADLVLATGGCGALFSATTNPPTADGNGLGLALALGVPLRDAEFVQFHPTALDIKTDGPLPLITEALRGAGARLVDDAGCPIMDARHPMGDLAPRDQVARCVWEHRQLGGNVWLDATELSRDWIWRFPTVHAIARRHGIDPRRERMPVTPAAHFHMGGIAVDLDGRTGVPGLHAVGEVACTGVHGANRLASNSLLEGVVFGRRLGRHLADSDRGLPRSGAERWIDRGASADQRNLRGLRELAWECLGPVRNGDRMAEAVDGIRTDDQVRDTWQGKVVVHLLQAAIHRRQSLGTHFRDDRPRPVRTRAAG